jgi:hypothetical protein
MQHYKHPFMSRPLRLEYCGAVFHLTSRGNARQKIFWGDSDRELFLEITASPCGASTPAPWPIASWATTISSRTLRREGVIRLELDGQQLSFLL